MNRLPPEEFGDPVDLPEGVHHGGHTAYGRHGCRCRYCVQYRRLYDKWARLNAAAGLREEKRSARDYLAWRGIQVYGPGPFRRNPIRLAQIVAAYFNDDLAAWREQ